VRASLFTLLLVASVAYADGGFLDRPLLLARGAWEAELSGTLAQQPSNSGTGLTTDFTFEAGLPWKLQAGFFLRDVQSFDEGGENALSTLVFNVQRSLDPHLAMRLDVGIAAGAQAFSNSGGVIEALGPAFGLGLPFRYRFDQQFALISGGTSARAFGSPTAAGDAVAFTPSDDLVTLNGNSQGCALPPTFSPPGVASSGAIPLRCGQVWNATFNLPVGIQYEAFPGVSFAIRSGFGLAFGVNPTAPTTAPSSPFFIPFSVDASFTPTRYLDFGLTAVTVSQPQALMANRSMSLWTRLRL
jgi:hypothetical protein